MQSVRKDERMRISPSALSTFNLCPRMWAYSRVVPRGAQTAAQALGDEVQDHLDAYLLDGVPPDLSRRSGRIALSGLKFLPAPGPENLVECKIEAPGPNGITYTGRVDLIRPSSALVLDHKTSGDITRGLYGDAFAADFQRIIYADATEFDRVETRWVYYQTREPFVSRQVVRFENRADVVALRAKYVDPIAMRLQAAAHLPVLEQPRNFSACNKPYTCRYKDRCYADEALPKELTAMGIIDDLKAKAAAQKAGATQQPKPEPQKEPEPEPESELQPEPAKRGRPKKAAPPKPEELAASGDVLDHTVRKILRDALAKLVEDLS